MTYHQRCALVTLALAGVLSAQTCPGEISPVDVSSADIVIGDGSPALCTEQAIRDALAQGGTIRCDCGSAPPTVTVSSEFVLDKDVVFDGGGITLDGGGSTRIFRKINKTANQRGSLEFTLQNVTLQNGMGDSLGGAVLNQTFGKFHAINVNFVNNHCAEQETPDWGGGAVYNFLQTEVDFANCTFTNNSGANGGAVAGIGNSMNIYNCVFDGNRATGQGGGADAGPTGQGGIGGAVYIDNLNINGVNAYLAICRSTFADNQSNAHAGALFCYMHSDKGATAVIDQCTFSHNSEAVNQAGAIYVQNRTLDLTNSTFVGNTTPSQGGALWSYQTSITINNCTFDSNSTTGDYGMGGAIAAGTGALTISNCTFAHNTATHFAAVIKRNIAATISNSLFMYNGLDADAPSVNYWAGSIMDKNIPLNDLGGNMASPRYYGPDFIVDEFLKAQTGITIDDAELEPLADNGGPTMTMALPEASPAVNAGNGTCSAADQRGVARVGGCDAGAFEYGELPVLLHTPRSAPVGPAPRVTRVLVGPESANRYLGVCYDVRGRRVGGANRSARAVRMLVTP